MGNICVRTHVYVCRCRGLMDMCIGIMGMCVCKCNGYICVYIYMASVDMDREGRLRDWCG